MKVTKTDKLKVLSTSISRNYFLEGALDRVLLKFYQSNEELFQGFQKYSHELAISKALLQKYINPISASVALTEKPVNWFVQQISWLVSIWGQHWDLMGQKKKAVMTMLKESVK